MAELETEVEVEVEVEVEDVCFPEIFYVNGNRERHPSCSSHIRGCRCDGISVRS